ncbi:MAG TPA: exo-alpha-sialidase [Verrucomicrobiales bacterium]|nr:exo-alpha-sialidase [Verrucomicrobiales bacterium]
MKTTTLALSRKPAESLFLWLALCFLLPILSASSATKVLTKSVPFNGKRAKTYTDNEGRVHLLFNQKGNIFYSLLNRESQEFSKPVQVNSIEKCAAIGELAIGKNGQVHVLFHGNIFYIREKIKHLGRKLKGSDIRYTFYTRLNETGTGFEAQRDLSAGTWGYDGGCALAADSKGNVYTFVGGLMQEGKEKDRRIFMRHSSDNGLTFSEPTPIDIGKGVCVCCHLKAQCNSEGQLTFVYRIAENRSNRDSYVLTSSDHGKTFQNKFLDHWELNACPGGVYSVVNLQGKTIVAGRNKEDIYMNISGSNELIMPSGKYAKRRSVVMGNNQRGEILMAWGEGTNFNKSHDLSWQIYGADGAAIGKPGSKENAFGRWGNGAVYADTNGDFIILH